MTFNGSGAHYPSMLQALAKKHPRKPTIVCHGNIDTEEIWSSITHGLGVLWSIVAGIYMMVHVSKNPSHHIMACMIYSVCHFLLFLFSCLYHALFLKVRVHPKGFTTTLIVHEHAAVVSATDIIVDTRNHDLL